MRPTLVLGLCCILLFALQAADQTSVRNPRYTADGQLVRPTDYREWIFLSSGLGMTYGNRPARANDPRFTNVFVEPSAYREFTKTGQWPDKSMFILEIRSSTSQGSINKDGHFQNEVVAIEASVKDESRFKQKWAYIDFSAGGTLHDSAKPFEADSSCNSCHAKNGAVDNTFVQFYPTLLEVAKAKSILKAAAADH